MTDYTKTWDPFKRRFLIILSYVVINLSDVIPLDFTCVAHPAGEA
jgi:hypothetical protein